MDFGSSDVDELQKLRKDLLNMRLGEKKNDLNQDDINFFHGYGEVLPPEIKEIYERQYDDVHIPDEFRVFKKISATGKVTKLDMLDNEFLGQSGYKLYHVENKSLAIVGRAVIPMFTGGFTTRGAGYMMLLAYNLRKVHGSFSVPVYPDCQNLETPGDMRIEELSDVLRQPTFRHIRINEYALEGVDENVEAAYYCFLAACTLRMYTKSAENFGKAWTHIQNYFLKLYKRNPPIILPTPKDLALKDLATWYRYDPRAKQTFYRILYIGSDSLGTDALRSFCIEMHVTLTGLHLIALFISLCGALNCDPGILLAMINVNEYERQVECMIAFLKMLQAKDEGHARGMWKYGRVFDDCFLADIQTKQCPKLVCVFASACKGEMPEKYKSVFNITHIASFPDIEKRRCAAVAQKMVEEIRQSILEQKGTNQ